MTTAPVSALAELRASAATPDEKAFATISGRAHVQFSLAAGYYGWASVADLERQLTRLAKLLFVARMKAYYVARSRDFGQLFTKESPPAGARDEQFVRARSGLVVEGEAAGGAVRISAVGMESWAVHLEPDVQKRLSEQSFCAAVSSAASQLVAAQFAQVKELKREVYAGS
ncbi:MAG: hypothetical protein ABIO16_18060 [Nocardioides sp.]